MHDAYAPIRIRRGRGIFAHGMPRLFRGGRGPRKPNLLVVRTVAVAHFGAPGIPTTAGVRHGPGTLRQSRVTMAPRLIGRAGRYLSDAGRAFQRAPVEVGALIVVAAVFSYTVQSDTEPDLLGETAITALLIITAAWTGSLLNALGAWTARRRWLVTGAGAVVVGLYAWRVLDLERMTESWRATMFLAAAGLWLLAVPVLAGPRGNVLDGATDRVRGVAARVLLRAFGAGLYSAALFAGLALALAAIDTLFELNLDGRIYAHVAGWIFLVLGPWIVIGGLPEYAQPVEPRREVAGVAHRMTAFLVPPLLVLYYAILYAYTVRIGLTGEVPKNLVSPLVIAAGVLAALALFLFDPRAREAGSSRLLRAAPPLFLPLAALGIYAVSLRVGQYGWTEFRLLRLIVLAALGLVAAAGTVQLLRRQRFALHAAPLVVAAVLVLGAVGPWGVPAVARASQQARLNAALVEAGMDPVTVQAAPAAEMRTVPHGLYRDIRSTALYLAQFHGPGALPPALAAHATNREAVSDLPARAGLRSAPAPPDLDRSMAAQLVRDTDIRLAGMTVRRVGYGPGRGADAGQAMVVPETTLLRVPVAGEWLTADFGFLGTAIDGEPGRGRSELSPDAAQLAVHDDSGTRRGTLLVLNIGLQTEAGVVTLRHLDALLLMDAPEESLR
jgi:hypothetical protein